MKIKLKKYLVKIKLLLFIMAITLSAFCQEEIGLIQCGTSEYESFRIQQNPNLISIKELLESDSTFQSYKTMSFENYGIIRIPIVVHLIGDYVISTITQTRVDEQINILNDCFRKKSGSECYGNGEDTEIEFCLAQTDPDGFSTNGIVNITGSYNNNWEQHNDDATIKGLSHWSSNNYLNIYVVRKLYNTSTPIAAYSTFPWFLSDAPEKDGIVIREYYFGKQSQSAAHNQGKILVHEVGHWFGLFHTFQKGQENDEVACKNDDCSKNGDLICDTPPVNAANIDNCPSGQNSCSTDDPDENDPIENMMDYTSDPCKNMFTFGQEGRIKYYIQLMRADLTNSPAACTQPYHCTNGIQDADETMVDCGGADCAPCNVSSSGEVCVDHCDNCKEDCDELSVDCGSGIQICQPCSSVQYFGTLSTNSGTFSYYLISQGMNINESTSGNVPCIDFPFVLKPIDCYWKMPIILKDYDCDEKPNRAYCTQRLLPPWNCRCKYIQYFIEIAEVDVNFVQIGSAYSNWLIDEYGQYKSTGYVVLVPSIIIDQSKISELGISLNPGKLYRIKLADNYGGWQETVRYFKYTPQNTVSFANTNLMNNNDFFAHVPFTLPNNRPASEVSGGNITLDNVTTTNPYNPNNIHLMATHSISITNSVITPTFIAEITGDECNIGRMANPDSSSGNTKGTGEQYAVGSPQPAVNNPQPEKQQPSTLTSTSTSITPNPSEGKFKIQNEKGKIQSITIYNVLGETIYKSQILNPKSQIQIDISNEPKGIYFVKIITPSRQLAGRDGLVPTELWGEGLSVFKIIYQ